MFCGSISGGENMVERPYFLENKNWYWYDYTAGKYMIKDSAPERAKKSYEEFQKTREGVIV